MQDGTPTLRGIHHAKLPARDLEATRDWYCRVFGFSQEIDFVEDGRLMGVGLLHPPTGLRLGLRHAPDRVTALADFDPIAWAVESKEDLDEWAEHLDRQGVPHGEVVEATIGWIIPFHDPDGREVKLYTLQRPEPHS